MLKRKALEIDWVIEDTRTLVKKARLREDHSIYSEPCEGWKLSAWTQQDQTCVGLFLHPVDLKKETRVSFELKATPESKEDVCFGVHESAGTTFEANSSVGWGTRHLLDETALRRTGKHKLRITCKITWGEKEKPAPTSNCMKFFNKQEYSDTVLVPGEGKYTLFVQSAMLRGSEHFKTILDSYFSESESTTRLSPLSPPTPDDRFLGDVNEFAAFGVQNPRPEQDVSASQDDNAVDVSAAHPKSTSSSGPSGAEELVSLREFRLIKVPDCSYATLAAYLSYLYSSLFDFLPSPAVLLAQEKEPGSSTKSDFSKWADEQAKSRKYPALPHAMYRLADCYMEPKVKNRAKEWILQNITVETAPFELFSQLSLDYPEFQADVVDFVGANLASLKFPELQQIHTLMQAHAVSGLQNEVLGTPGWERAVALINEGKIPDGAVILNKVLSKSSKAAA